MTGRNLNRNRGVLGTPIEVRKALHAGDLELADAVKIAALDKGSRTEIARRIRDGENAGLIVAEMVDLPERRATLDAILDRLSGALDQASKSFEQLMQESTGG